MAVSHKKTAKSKVKRSLRLESVPDVGLSGETTDSAVPNRCCRPNKTKTAIIIAAIVIFGVLLLKRGYLVSAIVNGNPIFSWQTQSVLSERFGAQILEGLITERLIAGEAQKVGVKVTQAEIDQRANEMVASIGGGVTLDELLQYQGMTKKSFNNQIKMQLLVERVLSKDIVFTDNELTNFIATNSAILVATEPAALKEEARQILTEEEISKKVQPWFTELKNKAAIIRF